MPEPDAYSYPRYLRAKITVDDRALHRRVWDQFVDALVSRPSDPLRVLEVGAGVGATAERLIDALEDAPVDSLTYTLVDVRPDNVEAAQETLAEWARDHDYDVWGANDRIVLSGGPIDVAVEFVTADLFDLPPSVVDPDEGAHDAVIAQAVFDILDVNAAFEALRPSLAEDGLWYLPIHFDGVTAFEPPVDAGLDGWIERLYHESMSEGGPGDVQDETRSRGGAHTGRHLLTHVQQHPSATLLDAGSSDWVVFARENDRYPGDEAYFLHHILHFVEEELQDHPDLDTDNFADWIATRRRQIDDGELIYVAHQLDVLAREGGEA